ncbi:MAG: hypothetical protein GFH27_549291n95 [Chloroflexi bacterium AL-W]|nr:hypothetical protein [Chloroflexi bacterium AL-N1]NOK67438.1 hypothetical protein [Chloroflexi bacterium AL-N10]NOK75070.1 hypothetical protein [Chloroflexi bacterium AL-N5]NOK81857.1 hypothetical protein [Chloroflexi bacterium AL-W]NOK89703.1 hypothetical protein [Chloroflexi bacterium AL-N15]
MITLPRFSKKWFYFPVVFLIFMVVLAFSAAQAQTTTTLPPAKLLHQVDLTELGDPRDFFRASAQFGDLNNDGVSNDFIRYSNSRRMQAIAYDGADSVELLWDTGPDQLDLPEPPNRYFYKYTIWDVDSDGRSEVIGPFATAEGNIELRVLDGATGNVKQRIDTDMPNPTSSDTIEEWRIYVTIANVRGLDQPRDIVLLTEFNSRGDIFVYDDQLELLWDTTADNDTKSAIYGHYAWNGDIDGDGKDEIIGNWVFDDDGTKLWRMTPDEWEERDISYDHIDRAFIGDFDPANEGTEILISYEYLFARMYSNTGEILWNQGDSDENNADQADSKITAVGDFTTESEGIEILVQQFPTENGEDGKTIFDANGNPVKVVTSFSDGFHMDWDGDRSTDEMFNPRNGTVIDPWNDASITIGTNYQEDRNTRTQTGMRIYGYALDMVGDYREEVVIIDEDELMIYGAANLPPADHPSPWSDPRYGVAVANSASDNHPERPWFDIRSLPQGPDNNYIWLPLVIRE